jgi:hydroxyethylthiazole kinase-like uncharacterized protein yjeF
VRADLTMSFSAAKPGHYLAQGPAHCGALAVADIGLPVAVTVTAAEDLRLARPDLGALAKRNDAHKYDHGHALILAGGAGKGGAARMAARAALRIGAGLVSLGVPGAALQENAAQLNAIMLRRIDDAEALEAALEDARLSAIGMGFGLGVGARTRELCRAALAGRRGVVLDADALTSFAETPEALFVLCHDRVVLTPHGGEFARLFPDLAKRLEEGASRLEVTRAAAARSGAVVLLKGPDTVISGPRGRARICATVYEEAAPWLATAGAGDVLAGLITGLLARGMEALDAAETGAWVHGACARAFGPGLIAEDLPEQVPGVLRRLLGMGQID